MQTAEKRPKTSIAQKIIIAVLVAVFVIFCIFVQYTEYLSWGDVYTSLGLSDFSVKSEKFPFQIHSLDVGKADAILIKSNDVNILIDAGTVDYDDMIIEYLERHAVKKLDIVIASHPDKDHIGSMSKIIKNIPINRFLMPDIPNEIIPNSKEYEKMIKELEKKSIHTINPNAGDSYDFGDLKIQILAPFMQYEQSNDNSIVAKFIYKNKSFLFAGDAEKESETDMINSEYDISADVIKIGHHGSKTATSDEFLKEVDPKYAIISVGKDRNNLPNNSVLSMLEYYNVDYRRTDYSGTVILVSDGENIEWITEE